MVSDGSSVNLVHEIKAVPVNHRTVTYLTPQGDWVSKAHFNTVKAGTVFKVFEPDGETPVSKITGYTIFQATRDAFQDANGVWTIETVDVA